MNSEASNYGLVEDILEVKYFGSEHSTIVIFKCTSFDNEHSVVLNKNKLVNGNSKTRLQTNKCVSYVYICINM